MSRLKESCSTDAAWQIVVVTRIATTHLRIATLHNSLSALIDAPVALNTWAWDRTREGGQADKDTKQSELHIVAYLSVGTEEELGVRLYLAAGESSC